MSKRLQYTDQNNYINFKIEQVGKSMTENYFMPKDKTKAQQDLQNFSFFQLGNSYDLASMRKSHFFNQPELASWSQNQQSHLAEPEYPRTQSDFRKKSVDFVMKRTSNIKFRSHHSVSLRPKQINLFTRVTLKTQINIGMSITSYPKIKIQKPENIKDGRGKSINQRQVRPQKKLVKIDLNPQKKAELQTQPSCNFINYPISSVLIRKRKFKKNEKFPFHSLALRLNL